jgi:hypothetical protein
MNTSRFCWVIYLVGAVLTGCQTGPTPPVAQDYTPIIPATTKVADASTRDALTAYDAKTGTMRFAKVTASLAALKADDVLVSEPSSAAPDGYLRKVKAVRQEGEAVVLETTQANLTDAISQGSLNGAGDLKPEDLRSAKALVKGVKVGLVPQSDIDVGDGYSFLASFDETVLDINEGDVKVKVRVSGELRFKAGYNVGIDIHGPSVSFSDGFEGPGLDRFEAWVGIEQRSKLRVTGDAVAKISKEKKVAEYRFAPKCFTIVVVPVCVVPTVYVFVGASGEVNLHFAYEANQSAQSKMGAAWTSKNGWQKIPPSPTFDTSFSQQIDVNAALKASVYIRSDAALMIYGISGLALSGKLGFELDVAIPRNPLWIVRATFEGSYLFIVDLPIVGRLSQSGDALYSISKEAARSPNSPPKLALTNRDPNVPLGLPASLGAGCDNLGSYFYTARDPEDNCLLGVTIVSSLDGPVAPNHTFQTAGPRTITVTARDTNGATATISFGINVVNTPPIVYGSVPESTQATVPMYFSLAALDPNSGRLDCAAISVSGVSVQAISTQDGDCQYTVTINQQGTQTINALATDPQGASSTAKNFSVLVKAAPLVPPPLWTIPPGLEVRYQSGGSLVRNEGNVGCYSRLTLRATATDPGGKAVTYTWQAAYSNGNVKTLPTNPDGTATYSGTDERVQFRVTASNGTSQNNPLLQFVVYDGVCVR